LLVHLLLSLALDFVAIGHGGQTPIAHSVPRSDTDWVLQTQNCIWDSNYSRTNVQLISSIIAVHHAIVVAIVVVICSRPNTLNTLFPSFIKAIDIQQLVV
jgi:hypothetical protein